MTTAGARGVYFLRHEQVNSPKGISNKVYLSGTRKSGTSDLFEFDYLHVNEYRLRKPEVLDGFVCAVIFFLMEHAFKLKVEGSLSHAFVRNIRLFCEAWHCWLPDLYSPVDLEAVSYKPSVRFSFSETFNAASRLRHSHKQSLLTFSGGIDSCFSLMRHSAKNGSLGIQQRHRLEHVVMVHGFDVDYDNDLAFKQLCRRNQPVLDHFGVTSYIVKTNIRHRLPQNWEHSFAAQIASVLHQYSDRFSFGIIGSSEPYSAMINAWGSHPATDYLLSSDSYNIVHDGAGFSRTQKLSQMISIAPIIDNLKVCWEGQDQSGNCGVCEKCIRTKLNFIASGHQVARCFDNELGIEDVLNMPIRNQASLQELISIIEYSRMAGTDGNVFIKALVQRLGSCHHT